MNGGLVLGGINSGSAFGGLIGGFLVNLKVSCLELITVCELDGAIVEGNIELPKWTNSSDPDSMREVEGRVTGCIERVRSLEIEIWQWGGGGFLT